MAENLTGPQYKLLEALLEGQTVPMAAQVAGVSERTARRWTKQPLFHAELQARAAEMMDATTQRLSMTMLSAPLIVHQIMLDKKAPEFVRLNAARIALDSGLKLLEARNQEAKIQDALERLGRLEEQQEERLSLIHISEPTRPY